MKKTMGAVLTAAMLFTGLGVVTATSAQAAVRIGPYTTLAACQYSQAMYTTYGDKKLLAPCFRSGVKPYNYYFTVA